MDALPIHETNNHNYIVGSSSTGGGGGGCLVYRGERNNDYVLTSSSANHSGGDSYRDNGESDRDNGETELFATENENVQHGDDENEEEALKRRARRRDFIRRASVGAAGAGLVVAGVAMLLLPGPRLVTMAAGVHVLGKEFESVKKAEEKVLGSISCCCRQDDVSPQGPLKYVVD